MLQLLVQTSLVVPCVSAAFDATSQRYLSHSQCGGGLRRREDDDLPVNWVRYAEKGVDYYKNWLSTTGDDEALPNLRDFMDFEEWEGDLSPFTTEIMRQAHVPVNEKNCISSRLVWPRSEDAMEYYDKRVGHYQCSICVSEGVLLVQKVNRGDTPWPFSTIAWWLWIEAVKKQHRDSKVRDDEADYSGLKSMWWEYIANEETEEIISYALRDKNDKKDNSKLQALMMGETHYFKPGDPDCPDLRLPFWPLLGSPLGRTAVCMLAQHKLQMRGKGINSLVTHEKEGGNYVLWAEFGFEQPTEIEREHEENPSREGQKSDRLDQFCRRLFRCN